jgi:tRNA-dihydrouridine synthase
VKVTEEWGGGGPLLALAPMQDVTDWAFWRLTAGYGAADVYFTEYFRVLEHSRLDRGILRSVVENPTGRPAVAQMIGSDVAALVRTARELEERHPVAGVDLNLGCPAPVVYRKCAGGGLLRDLPLVDRILGELRAAIQGRFTVKTRLGFAEVGEFDALLEVFGRHEIDLLSVHGRTVAERYRPAVHYGRIADAVAAMRCPVLANGNVASAAGAVEILRQTGAAGLMVGRGAIRNPWIFSQIRARLRGDALGLPSGRDVLDYVSGLYESTAAAGVDERRRVQRVKKVMNYLALGVEPTGRFLHEVRRAEGEGEFFALCREYLDHGEPMPLEPFELGLKETDVLAGVHGAG